MYVPFRFDIRTNSTTPTNGCGDALVTPRNTPVKKERYRKMEGGRDVST